jgi:MFS family permease
MTPRLFYGWLIVACSFLIIAITVGIPFYGVPFFYDYFIREFGWNRGQTTAGIAIATILILPAGGMLIHRFSPRRMIACGAALLAVSLVGFGRMGGSLPFYYLMWCCFMAGYMFSGPIPNQVILSNWFRRRRGLAMGIAYLGGGVGGAMSQKYVALPLIHLFGWRGALQVMAGLMLLLFPLLVFVVRDKPAEKGLFPDGDQAPPPGLNTAPRAFSDLLRRRSFWLLAVGSLASIGAIGSINQHLKLLLQDARLPGALAADTTFVMLASSLAGRIVMGWLADRLPKKYVMTMAYLFVAGPIPLLYVIDRAGVPLLFAAVFGFGLGADFMLIPLMAAEQFGTNSLARAMSVILPADSIAQTFFPFLLGFLYDRTGSYNTGLALLFILAMAGACAILALPKKGEGG